MTLEEYFKDWLSIISKQELNKIIAYLSIEYQKKNIYPKQPDVFKAFKLCTFKDLKIVMLGQDIYSQKEFSTGILFGNKANVQEKNLSPSLKIIKEACINFEIPHNSIIFDPTLETWAKQGILMLDLLLTKELNKIDSHAMIWKSFTIVFLKRLSQWRTGLIYVLFGKQAQFFKPYINNKFNVIIETEHPTYYIKNKIKMPSELFTTINRLYKDRYGNNIEWYKEY